MKLVSLEMQKLHRKYPYMHTTVIVDIFQLRFESLNQLFSSRIPNEHDLKSDIFQTSYRKLCYRRQTQSITKIRLRRIKHLF